MYMHKVVLAYYELCVLTLRELKLAQRVSLPAAKYEIAGKNKATDG